MKIALLIRSIPKSHEMIKTFSDVWFYYLPRALIEKGADVALIALPDKTSDPIEFFRNVEIPSGVDAIVAVGLRYFTSVPRECYLLLKERFPNIPVCQIYDGSLLDGGNVDLTFTLRDDSSKYPLGSENHRHTRHHAHNKYVGWAADPEMIKSQQSQDVLTFFVDHPAFDSTQNDRTLEILINIKDFVLSGKYFGYSAVKVLQLVSGRIKEIDFHQEAVATELYDRKAVPFVELSDAYSKSHVFFVTHKETVGQCVIEAATAGALVVVPADLVASDRLSTVRSISYSRLPLNWGAIIEAINPSESRAVATNNSSWAVIAERMVGHISSWSPS